eukprot:1780125-Rhodomonas_salina.1
MILIWQGCWHRMTSRASLLAGLAAEGFTTVKTVKLLAADKETIHQVVSKLNLSMGNKLLVKSMLTNSKLVSLVPALKAVLPAIFMEGHSSDIEGGQDPAENPQKIKMLNPAHPPSSCPSWHRKTMAASRRGKGKKGKKTAAASIDVSSALQDSCESPPGRSGADLAENESRSRTFMGDTSVNTPQKPGPAKSVLSTHLYDHFKVATTVYTRGGGGGGWYFCCMKEQGFGFQIWLTGHKRERKNEPEEDTYSFSKTKGCLEHDLEACEPLLFRKRAGPTAKMVAANE